MRSSGEFFGHGQLTPRFLIQERILEATTAVESACRGIVLLNLEGYLAATHVMCNDFDFLQERLANPLPPEIFQHHKIMDIYQWPGMKSGKAEKADGHAHIFPTCPRQQNKVILRPFQTRHQFIQNMIIDVPSKAQQSFCISI